MDVNWCFCGQQVEGESVYCSEECLSNDRDATPLHGYAGSSYSSSDCDELDHITDLRRPPLPRLSPSRWAGTDHAGILAWARDIPPPCDACKSKCSPRTPVLRPPTFPLTRQRPVPPALCRSTTQPARTQASRPISTPPASGARAPPPACAADSSFSSLVSALTESVATPASAEKQGVLGGLASRLRAWGAANTAAAAPAAQKPPRAQVVPAAPTDISFTVLSTAHPLHSELLFPAAGAKEAWRSKEVWDGEENHPGTVWISKAKGGALQRERPPVSLRLESDIEHSAYLARGRKLSRAGVHRRGHAC